MRPLSFVFISLLAVVAAPLHADVIPASLFTNNAVLQRDKPVPVWGTASAGEPITVSFAGQSVATTADAQGRWQVTLAPQPANAAPNNLIIQGSNTITLTNIVVGEVWIASGQSNMSWPVSDTYDAALDIPASAHFPLIRHIKIDEVTSNTPAHTARIVRDTWEPASPSTTSQFSATGYFFALNLYQLLNVPIGIIGSNKGGTQIELWIDPVTGAKINSEKSLLHESPSSAKSKSPAKAETPHQAQTTEEADDITRPSRDRAFSGLYNAMIHPLIPYAIRGVIWYQGESNAKFSSDYHLLFTSLITGWRTQFGQGDFPFYWVQLANFTGSKRLTTDPESTHWAFLREAQTKALTLPNTGQAIITDIGHANDIHPGNKSDVGRRLARLALARTYGFPLTDSAPVFDKAIREGAGYRVSFTPAESRLMSPLNTVEGFEVAGADRVFKPALAELKKNTVFVSCPEIPEPVAIRYNWKNSPIASLFNREGLPVPPFRTDTW